MNSKPVTPYLNIEPWSVSETGYRKDRSRVSESIFSLSNEFMGIRGFFEEGYGGDTLIGSYFNGVFDEMPHVYPLRPVGFPERNHFMVNSVNWLWTRLVVDGERLDLARAQVSGFVRRLDLRTGILARSFVWELVGGRRLRVGFFRLLGMRDSRVACQRIELEALDFCGTATLSLGLDFSPPHTSVGRNLWTCPAKHSSANLCAIIGETIGSRQRVASAFRHDSSLPPLAVAPIDAEKLVGVELQLPLEAGQPLRVEKVIVNQTEKDPAVETFWQTALDTAGAIAETDFDREAAALAGNWEGFWQRHATDVEGDPAFAQGLRYCMFQLRSTYHGVDAGLNIGAKGLTGEAYGGLAFWDTESYCLPFYLFTDPAAARNLLGFRYRTLDGARERARQLGCRGARFPMTTIDGTEACGVWYHGDLEIHVPAAVAYGVWQYVHVTGDRRFLYDFGVEMLVEISRFYASHGGWSPKTGEFGLWGVMGADEFHMMVHNNAYTNAMAKKTFEWTLRALDEMRRDEPGQWEELALRLGWDESEPAAWAQMARKMRLQKDPETGLIEQHDGFFDLPHIDLASIPPEKQPICVKYPYIQRSRHDWIKQPDVLLLPFFFGRDYTTSEKLVNYEYYEPRCLHESSLSPGVHAILAAELGKHELAFRYVQYASRLDLDDYNGNTSQGLHMTSMAAAWMSLAYGFGGMRADGPVLSFRPCLPSAWDGYAFRIVYRGTLLDIRVSRDDAVFRVLDGPPVAVEVYGEATTVGPDPLRIPLQRLPDVFPSTPDADGC